MKSELKGSKKEQHWEEKKVSVGTGRGKEGGEGGGKERQDGRVSCMAGL